MATNPNDNKNTTKKTATSSNKSSTKSSASGSAKRPSSAPGSGNKAPAKKKASGSADTQAKKDAALNKFDVDINAGRKKTSKVPKPKNPLKRFANAILPQKDDTKGDIARKILLLVAICVLIGTLAYLIYQLAGMRKGGEKTNELAISANAVNSHDVSIAYSEPDRLTYPTPEIPTTAGNEEPEFIDLTPVVNYPLDIDFDYLKSINPDVRAWVKITGTLVNNVVMASDTDTFYIDHNMEREESISGEIFADWRTDWDGTDDNIVLYGHNMASGYFFAYVNWYVPKDSSREPLAFYKTHPTILFQTDGGESETYKIFAGFLANTDPEYGEVFNYTGKQHFSDVDDFNQFILDVMDRSWFYTDVDIQYGDKLLTLSTCHWPLGRDIETRWVVMARKVRPGESEYVDTSVATRNWGQKLFEYYYDVIGGQWYGSNWDTSKLLSLY